MSSWRLKQVKIQTESLLWNLGTRNQENNPTEFKTYKIYWKLDTQWLTAGNLCNELAWIEDRTGPKRQIFTKNFVSENYVPVGN